MKSKIHEHKKSNMQRVSKTIYFSFLILFLSLNTMAQIINFPDANFKAKLLMANPSSQIAFDDSGNFIVIDNNGNNEIEVSEAQTVYGLHVTSSSISSLTGIEQFTNLHIIQCDFNNLTSLQPLSNLTNLIVVTCYSNMLTSIAPIENLSNLENLNIGVNPLTSVNLQNLHLLLKLEASNTSLSEINLCGTGVKWLWCMDSPNLQALYLKNNVVSSDLARTSMLTIPPPLHNFEFYNSPLLNFICYDEGEYPAVFHGIGENTTGKTLTTSCDANCSTLASENPQPTNLISFYPNPTSGIINIVANQTIDKTTIRTILGQTIMNFENTTSLDISSLAKGTYLITVETALGDETQKIIKL